MGGGLVSRFHVFTHHSSHGQASQHRSDARRPRGRAEGAGFGGVAGAVDAGVGLGSNLVIAKAANLIREYKLTGHTSAMIDAFSRLMVDPYKLDPVCAAITALAQTLLETGAGPEAERPYRSGLRHKQFDGPPEESDPDRRPTDTAASLRGYSALGLAALKTPDALTELTDLLGDKETVA